MRKKLTDRYLQSLRPPAAGRLEIMDTEARGLAVRITQNGVKSWAVRYSPRVSGQRRASYGTYPSISLAEARTRTKDIAAAASRGVDLVAQEAREAEEARKSADRPDTVAELLDRYLSDYCSGNQRRWQLTERMFEAHVKPAIGSVRLIELRRADIVEMLDAIECGGQLVSRVVHGNDERQRRDLRRRTVHHHLLTEGRRERLPVTALSLGHA